MWKYLAILMTGVLTSFYFFPFEFAFLPGANTKMVMAGISLVVLGIQLAQKRNAVMNKDFFILSLLACFVSLAGLISVSYNETYDYTYATYIISMWVWLGGAYLAISCIRLMHKGITVKLIAHYLIGVCVAQCILALLIDASPFIKEFVNTYIAGFDWVQFAKLEKGGRLYGIGAALDVAGLRFSAVLVMIAYLCMQKEVLSNNIKILCYLLAFCIIAIVGNMMARTTTLGVGLSLLYWVYAWFKDKESKRVWIWITIIVGMTILVSAYLYQVNENFKEDIRFAFEGFFSLWEKGEWSVSSNDKLMKMFVFPDNMKTWLVGDGYMENPYNFDPYYIGPRTLGYYMDTDVGYLRFIFYFGLIGLSFFLMFFGKATQICMRRFKGYGLLFLLILSVNLIGWVKVSTDIFLVFALFLCIDSNEKAEAEEHPLINS